MAGSQSTLAAALLRQYPWTASMNVAVVDATNKGDPARKLEFYQPTDDENPKPGHPTIEVFDKGMSPRDLMGEIYSHYLPKIDSNVADARKQIISSMTADQIDGIRGDYERDRGQNLVNGLGFSDWRQGIGGDSFFRGYATGQWPADEYTPLQKKVFDGLTAYLNSRYSNIPTPTPKPAP